MFILNLFNYFQYFYFQKNVACRRDVGCLTYHTKIPVNAEMASAGPTAGPFSQAVQAVLDSWSVLQVAVENGFGGADSSAKARWMVDAVTQWFGENSDLDPYEVEDFLADILNNEFNTLADDGSLKAIAEMICQSYS